ncbi:hypothetical protein [Bradyrhizobium sp. AUGA SZCCT0431]|nr:hypothetical protein [Bradyrhizobium sp. AUGA SZCCT0431]MBR1143464.1 hypothetical protein [Bradyrhizobium sp. AUGA SZCCT0431]
MARMSTWRWIELTMKFPWRDALQHIRTAISDHGLNIRDDGIVIRL